MAGSLAYFIYVRDDGTEAAVQLDEDTGNCEELGFEPYLGTPPLELLPQGAKMRYVNTVQASGEAAGYRGRPYPCGNPDADAFSGDAPTFELNGLTHAVRSSRGERIRRPTAFNTGLQGESSEVGGGDGGAE